VSRGHSVSWRAPIFETSFDDERVSTSTQYSRARLTYSLPVMINTNHGTRPTKIFTQNRSCFTVLHCVSQIFDAIIVLTSFALDVVFVEGVTHTDGRVWRTPRAKKRSRCSSFFYSGAFWGSSTVSLSLNITEYWTPSTRSWKLIYSATDEHHPTPRLYNHYKRWRSAPPKVSGAKLRHFRSLPPPHSLPSLGSL